MPRRQSMRTSSLFAPLTLGPAMEPQAFAAYCRRLQEDAQTPFDPVLTRVVVRMRSMSRRYYQCPMRTQTCLLSLLAHSRMRRPPCFSCARRFPLYRLIWKYANVAQPTDTNRVSSNAMVDLGLGGSPPHAGHPRNQDLPVKRRLIPKQCPPYRHMSE